VDERVVVGGREQEGSPATGGHRVGALVAVLVAVLAAVALARTPTIGPPEVEETPDALAAAEAVPATRPASPAERIEGWQWVLAIETPRGVLAWRPDAGSPQAVLSAPAGRIASDFSGRWLSLSTEGADGQPRPLLVGDLTRLEVLSKLATGGVWHPFEPGRLAFVESRDDRTVLMIADLDTPGSRWTELAEVPAGAVPVWWNGAGVTLQVGGAALVVDPRGHIAFADDGRLAPGGPAWAVIERGDRLVLVNPLLRQLGPAPWSADCSAPAAEPWGGSVAAVVCPVDGAGELQVWRFSGTGATQVAGRRGFDPGVRPAWAPGGRFVVATGGDGSTVVVFDLTTDEVHSLEVGTAITGLAVGR
jgi:hypothetical protein